MSESAMSHEAMLAGLLDIRLPPEAAGGMAADLAVAVGCAALAALLGVAAIRALSTRRSTPRPLTPAERIAALGPLPDTERRVALLHLLRETAPERYRALAGALYRPGSLTLAEIEAEVARLD